VLAVAPPGVSFKSDPTRNINVKLFTGYGGYSAESDLWESLLEAGLRGEPVPGLEDVTDGRGQPACWRNGGLFVFWSHECTQDWQTPGWVGRERKRLQSAEFARMFETDFVRSVGNFVHPDAWSSCVDPSLAPLPFGSDAPLYVGLDLAVKAGGDDAAIVALYPLGDKIAVALHTIWRGGKEREQDLRIAETVEPFLLNLARRYNVRMIGFDVWQSYDLLQRLANRGLPTAEVPQTHGRRGLADTILRQSVINGDLVLYDHEDLAHAADLAHAKQVGENKIFITRATRSRPIDLLIAMSNAVYAIGADGQRVTRRVVYAPEMIGGRTRHDWDVIEQL
jgi:hypothetical protein